MREDLAALTPEALTALTNAGLVKRAQREIAAGQGPALAEDAAGTVTGTFPDGAVARLARSVTLDAAACTCGAPRACRHRVAVALAYAAWQVAAVAAPAAASWTPADVTDAALETALGPRLLDAARATRDRGLVVRLETHGAPAAHLPACTVRFLVPGDITFAKCDCADVGGRCEHLALAVFAFRALAPGVAGGIVSLGAATAPAAPRADERDATLDLALDLAHAVLDAGVGAAPPLTARFATARAAAAAAGYTWLHALLGELEIALEGHARRSARHGTREIAALLTELAARVRAGRRDGPELPARFVLGADHAPETLLDHLRLVSLGARVAADGAARFADVYLADPDTATVLVFSKRWDFPAGTAPEEGPALARRALAPRITLGALAGGALVSKAVKRRASRAIALSAHAAGRTSLTPQVGDYANLPAPLLVTDLAAHAAHVAHRPPRLVRPRVLAEEVHVVAVSRVDQVVHDEAEQTLLATLADAAGRPFTLALAHRRCAPHALAATAAALAERVRYVTGDLCHGPAGWTLEPLALTTDRLVVPDLAGPPPDAAPLPRGARAALADPVEIALAAAAAALQELAHAGTAQAPVAARGRARAAAAALADTGLTALADRVRAAADHPAPTTWLTAALRLALVREATGLVPGTPSTP